MNILLYAPNYLPAIRYGGPVQSSHGLARALVRRGHSVSVFTTNVDGPDTLDVPADTPVDMDGVSVRYFPIATPRRFYRSPQMGKAIETEIAHYDAVHINGMYLWPGPRIAAAARRHKVRYIVAPRGMLVPEMIAGKSALVKRMWIACMERRNLAGAAAIQVTSDEEASGVRALGLALAPVAVIGNGVDAPAQAASGDDIERIWSGIPEGNRVAFLGRLDWTKGVDLAIAATGDCSPDAAILIAGPDQIGLQSQLEAGLKSSGGATNGRFIGSVDGKDKWALLAGADVLLAPSIKESFGMSVGEALAIGTPVICTEGVGAGSIVRRIDPACVVSRTREAVAGALRALLAEPERRSRYASLAKEIMAREYSWDGIAAQMEALYADEPLPAAHRVLAVPA